MPEDETWVTDILTTWVYAGRALIEVTTPSAGGAQRNGRFEDARGERRDPVEDLFPGRVEYVVAPHGPESVLLQLP